MRSHTHTHTPSASSSLSCCPVRRKYFLRATKMVASGMTAMKMYGRMMDTVKMAPVTISVSWGGGGGEEVEYWIYLDI